MQSSNIPDELRRKAPDLMAVEDMEPSETIHNLARESTQWDDDELPPELPNQASPPGWGLPW